MWIFGSNSFVSIVEDWNDNEKVFVRSRRKQDLLDFLSPHSASYEIIHTPKNDYHYRVRIDKCVLGLILCDLASKVNYTNFKDSIDDADLYRFAAETWNSGYRNLHESKQ